MKSIGIILVHVGNKLRIGSPPTRLRETKTYDRVTFTSQKRGKSYQFVLFSCTVLASVLKVIDL